MWGLNYTVGSVSMATTKAYFNVEGKWFTWFLRHQWVEGNEVASLKTWLGSFPDHSDLKSLNSFFIPIVTGKKKFTGWAAPDGFDIVKDSKKYWDPDQSGKQNKSYPLLDGWHDVFLVKKTKMFIAELRLRAFRLNRIHSTTLERCDYNSLAWLGAVEENKIENTLRKEVNKYWTEIRNISRQFSMDLCLETLPEDDMPLKEGPTSKDPKISNRQKRIEVYKGILNHLNPIQKYFDDKYGPNSVYLYNVQNIKNICALDDEEDVMFNSTETDVHWSTTVSSSLTGPFKGLSMDDFVKDLLKDSERTEVNPEDASETQWRSGYISPQGEFFGCSNFSHVNFASDLCEKFGYNTDEKDAQDILDKRGWVKISLCRFFYITRHLTESQKTTMYNFMQGKKMKKAMFNCTLSEDEKTFEEAMDQ